MNIVTMTTATDGTYVSTNMILSSNSFGIITPNAQTTVALHNGTLKKACPHTYLPTITLILCGLFVFVGFGFAVYIVRTIASNNNDD